MSGTSSPSLPVEWYEAEYTEIRRTAQGLREGSSDLAWIRWYGLQQVMHRVSGSLEHENLLGTFNRARDGFMREQLVLKETYERYIIAKLTG